MFAISFSLLLSYACLGISAEQLVGGGGKQIFLLAGQSNMSGRGGVVNETWDHFIPPESFPNPSILRLTATQNWVAANEPLHKDIDVDKTCGVGPGMAFANSLLQKDLSINGVVGLVPCAVGGTNISEWGRGGHLYDQLMKRAEAALQGGGTIRGLLWYQGESDTVSWEDAELYKRRLERVFVHLRADLLSPVLPIIQVALASGQGPYIKEVREGQLGIKLMNVKTVDAKGMQLQPDGLHLSTLAQVTLGEMLANAFLQLQTLPTPALSTIHRAHASRSQGKHIILLAGQSNMSGRGGITNSTWNRIIPPECRPKASILRLSENLTWVVAQDPLHQDIDVNTTCGIGPGMPFARRLLEINPKLSPVGLVPCAVGGRQGTKISEWARGTFLYNQLVRRARAARQGGGRILGILWYQGESDSVSEEDANSYKVRLEKFFVDLRASLGSPMLPIIQVALASGQGPYTETVRQAQLGLKLGNVRCVDAKGLQLQPDHLHLSTPAQVRLGKLLAEAFLKTKPKTITVQTGGGP